MRGTGGKGHGGNLKGGVVRPILFGNVLEQPKQMSPNLFELKSVGNRTSPTKPLMFSLF